MSQLRRTPALLCLALLPLFAAPIAHAKDDHWTFEVAAGGGVTPRYSGSKEYRAACRCSSSGDMASAALLGSLRAHFSSPSSTKS